MSCDSSESCWKPCWWFRFDLILTMRDIYIYCNMNPLKKFTSSRSTEFKDIFPWMILPNDHEDHPNQHENSHKLCDGMGQLVLRLLESQWKLRQQYGQNSQWKESHCRANTSVGRKKEIWKSRTVRITVRDPIMKVNQDQE